MENTNTDVRRAAEIALEQITGYVQGNQLNIPKSWIIDAMLSFSEFQSRPATLDKGEAYWKNRCELAEKYISESPCDPDIYPQQLKAFQAWQESLSEQPEAKP